VVTSLEEEFVETGGVGEIDGVNGGGRRIGVEGVGLFVFVEKGRDEGGDGGELVGYERKRERRRNQCRFVLSKNRRG